MRTIDYKNKEIEITDYEFDLVNTMLMVKGMEDGVKNIPGTEERFNEVKDQIIGEVLQMRKEKND